MAPQNLLFLVNIGRREQAPESELLQQFEQALQGRVPKYRLLPCDCKETAEREIASGLQDGIDTIWIGGGDGTIHHVLNYTYGEPISYGIVPMGTVNALARALHIPEDPLEAVNYLLDAIPTPIDVGEVGGHRFLCYASVGIHALIFHQVSSDLKKKWGKLAFWESAVRTLWHKSQLPRFTIEFLPYHSPIEAGGDEPKDVLRETGFSFVLSNVSNYAGFNIVMDSKPHGAGYLELHNFRRNRFRTFVKWFTKLKLMSRKNSAPFDGVTLHRLTSCVVTSRHSLSVQADGEPLQVQDPRRLEFRCLPGAARILLRRPEAQSLLSPDTQSDDL